MVAVCLWYECPTPGPYDGPKALYEHIGACHCAADAGPGPARTVTEFRCRWRGCSYAAARTSPEVCARHVQGHSGHGPHACAAPGCAAAFAFPTTLARHVRAAHPPSARCEWRGCSAPAPTDAQALLAHLLAEHRAGVTQGVQCGWQGCEHTFTQRDYRRHLERHCPDLYTCSMCLRSFRSQAALTNHERKHAAEKGASRQDPESDADALDDAPSGRCAAKKRSRDDDAYHPKPSGKRRRGLSILDEDEVELAVTMPLTPADMNIPREAANLASSVAEKASLGAESFPKETDSRGLRTTVLPVARQAEKEVIVIDDSDDETQLSMSVMSEITTCVDDDEQAMGAKTGCSPPEPATKNPRPNSGGKVSVIERVTEELLRARLLATTRVPERETRVDLRDELCERSDGDDWEYCT